jgi:hypothetical protein
MPEPLGRPVTISCFVDANHAGNVVTRWLHSGVLIFLMNEPIIWFSKRQNTVESSSFGSEFVAARIARDLIVSLRIKLRMFGCPINGPANVFCDNQGVVKNVSLPESNLSKKHNAINYHVVREAVAAGILRQRSLGYWSYECRSLDGKLLRGVEPWAGVQRLRMRHPRYDTKSEGSYYCHWPRAKQNATEFAKLISRE